MIKISSTIQKKKMKNLLETATKMASNEEKPKEDTLSNAPHPSPQLTKRQLESLKGIIDAFLPSLDPPPDETQHADFWTYELSSNDEFLSAMQETILVKLLPTQSWLFCMVLSLLSTTIGTCLIFGMLTTTPFSEWRHDEEQTRAMLSLKNSRWVQKRQLFSSMKRLTCALAFSFVDSNGSNPFWAGIGYPGPNHATKPDAYSMRDFSAKQENKNGEDHDTTTSPMIDVQEGMKLSYDVVIVGSGSGGGVAAATLASKGYSVLILEKAAYLSPEQTSNYEAEAFDKLYEAHGLLTTSDGNIPIMAGSALGGGTTINWSCCLPLPRHVRQEWVERYKLTQFEPNSEFDTALDYVQERIGCKDTCRVTHNVANTKFIEACQTLQYKWETTGQNLKDTNDARAGYICFGDVTGNKQSGQVTFLADAVDAGARIIDNCRVEQVLQGLYKSPTGEKRRRALGVVARVGGVHEIQVQAKKCVVVAAGALNTPCLLHKSWLRNEHIGRHLRLHPVVAVSGFFDQPIDCYQGAPMTTVCQEFQYNENKNGYGAKIECPSAHPGLLASGFQFIDPRHYRQYTQQIRKVSPLVVLQRDTSEGRVRAGEDGYTPLVDYSINDADKKSMMVALKGAIKMLLASGAQGLLTSHSQDVGFLRPESLNNNKSLSRSDLDENEEVQEYFREIEKRGFRDHEMSVFAAHQMGTCRMSAEPHEGVVDENGETWEVDDLFVFDTSTFPTASGANPMMTVLSMSRMLSTRLALRLLHEDEKLPDVVDPKVRQAMDVLRLRRLRVPQTSRSLVTSIALFVSSCLVIAAFFWFVWKPEFLPEMDSRDGEL